MNQLTITALDARELKKYTQTGLSKIRPFTYVIPTNSCVRARRTIL